MAEKTKTIERVYTVPLRKEFQRAPRWRRTKRAVSALRSFLEKHMKSDDVKLSIEVNQEMWKHGIKNPPGKIKVKVTKDAEGIVKADLFGSEKKQAPAKKKKATTPKK